MMIPMRYKEFVEQLPAGCSKTLKEQKSVFYIKPNYALDCVKVDKGIIKDIRQGILKCDFLLWDAENQATILVELKGTDVKHALEQFRDTCIHIGEIEDLSFLISKAKYVFACCVTPDKVGVPSGINESERALCKYLKKKAKRPSEIKNMLDLLVYVSAVKTVDKKVYTNKDRIFRISGGNPLIIYPPIWEQYIAADTDNTLDARQIHLHT